eukprot:scaffold57792_cov13-Tisochrysis_lutea.AAC.1
MQFSRIKGACITHHVPIKLTQQTTSRQSASAPQHHVLIGTFLCILENTRTDRQILACELSSSCEEKAR